MKVFDEIKSKDIDEFAEWLDKECGWFEGAPWSEYFDNTYCKNCEGVKVYAEYLNRDVEYGWCELYGKCKFFENLDKVPDNKQMIKMWLELEVEDN